MQCPTSKSKKREPFLRLKEVNRILYLAIPAMLAMLSQTAINIIDTYFIGQLEEPIRSNGQAMMSDALPLLWAVGGFFSAISVGTQAMVGRREGSGNFTAAGSILTNAVILAFTSSAIAAVICWYIIPSLFSASSNNPYYIQLGSEYTQWRFVGLVSMVVTAAFKAFYDGTGRTYIHFIAAMIMNVINLSLCWMLIFGNLGAPALGVKGAGVAAAISSWLGLMIMLLFTIRRCDRIKYAIYSGDILSASILSRLIRLSVPSGIASTVVMTGFLLFRQIVKVFDEQLVANGGVEAVNGAATTIIIEVLSVSFFSCLAFGIATATLVSQHLGAQNPKGAERYGWSSVKIGVLVFGCVGALEMIFPDFCIRLFNESPEVIRLGIPSMRLMGACGPLIAAGMILTQALFGAGNTRFVMFVELTLHFCVLLPVAYILGVVFQLGLIGVWSAAALYAFLLTVVMGWKFLEGSWKSINI